MKRGVITFVILVSTVLTSKAQPNGGFEDWSTEFSYENPDHWQTFNFLSLLSPPNPLSAFKAVGTDKHSGNYALKIKTVFLNNKPSQIVIGDSAGAVFTGKINYSPPSRTYGFPYTGRPENLEFWFKYEPIGTDAAGAGIMLLKWNGSGHDTIATGSVGLLATSTYTLSQAPLQYNLTGLPDTAIIIFTASNDSVLARVGSTLFIDDVQFTGWVGIGEQNGLSGKVKIFPNPARDNVNISTSIKEANEIKVFDSLGKLAGIYKIQNDNININTCLFSSGIYLYDINDKKENILFKGKFTVVK
ncbi:MAG: T9SS type A sorting domain-containing protein [Bacteroidota bacterium]|nr:T9SS type A sorting domain-containing protein [Bacteroidota bacterium]